MYSYDRSKRAKNTPQMREAVKTILVRTLESNSSLLKKLVTQVSKEAMEPVTPTEVKSIITRAKF